MVSAIRCFNLPTGKNRYFSENKTLEMAAVDIKREIIIIITSLFRACGFQIGIVLVTVYLTLLKLGLISYLCYVSSFVSHIFERK